MLERCPCDRPSTHKVYGEGLVTHRCEKCAKGMEVYNWTICRVPARTSGAPAIPQEDQ